LAQNRAQLVDDEDRQPEKNKRENVEILHRRAPVQSRNPWARPIGSCFMLPI
jgi:hypothetical protein